MIMRRAIHKSLSMNSNFDIEIAAKDEDDDYVQQFSTRLKSMMIFLVVLICVVTPYALNFEYSRAENSEQNLEDFLKVVDQVITLLFSYL